MPTVPVKPHCLRAAVPGTAGAAVDREARVLRGYVVAQAGVFKDRRGEFDEESLREIVRLGNAAPKGLRSHFTHGSLSEDGLGKGLGRSRDFRMGTAKDAAGKTVQAVRADLHFSKAASKSPDGDLAGYVMDLAEEDSDALSSSLVIVPDEQYRTDAKGRPLVDENGVELPPLWKPLQLRASDIVSVGDAVDGLLSANLNPGDLPDGLVRLASIYLDRSFPGAARDVVEARCLAWFGRYLELRYGPPAAPPATPKLDAVKVRLKEMELAVMRAK